RSKKRWLIRIFKHCLKFICLPNPSSQAHSSPRNYRNGGVDLLPNIGFYTRIPLVGISNTYSRLKNDNLRIIIKSKRIKSYRFEFEVQLVIVSLRIKTYQYGKRGI